MNFLPCRLRRRGLPPTRPKGSVRAIISCRARKVSSVDHNLTIVSQCAPHAAEIAEIVRAAFRERYGSGDGEAALIEALRADGDVVLELAALRGGAVAGAILFSRATAEPPLCQVAALA